MRRRVKSFLAIGLAAGLTASASVYAQQVNATVVLKSGDRHQQQNVAFRWDKGHVGTWRVAEVAYIDFADVPANVTGNLTGNQEGVILRDGTVVQGQVLELGADPATKDYLVIVRDNTGQERRLHSTQVARVVFAGGATAAASAAPAATAPATTTTTGTTGGGIVVPANQQWTSTGLTVRRGETIEFNTTGEIHLSGDAADIAGAAGSKAARMAAANAPVPNVLAGALIGRIGNGRPFPIGDQTSVQMPDSGQLFLGINDDHVNDNRGELRVEIRRSTRRR